MAAPAQSSSPALVCRRVPLAGDRATTSPATEPFANSLPGPKATTTDIMETTELRPRETPTGNGATPARLARKRFDPTQLFAQRDRLPWFWFFVAVAVSVAAALDRYHLIGQFKQRERVVIIDPAQTYYISPLLQFSEAKD